ncbi:Serine carboxypeptidase-like 26 [Heracleum sosnowskyi]|uniref:Serine carboxypeptidase-like 26 n=1 Tax=Heracleum sosnowskyi TaxID=360622 RepID=A0AAD8NBK4_9APIA|nr:Serine carboxypeptidase-like 26 [Heracleum sosnowskyi]
MEVVMIQSSETGAEEFNFARLVPCPMASKSTNDFSDSIDFAFGFSGHLQVPADVLFDGGKIRPLKLLPRSQYQQNIATNSPRSPRSPKRMLTKSVLVAPQPEKTFFSDYPLVAKPKEQQPLPVLEKQTSKDTTSSSSSSIFSSSIWWRRWKLTDLFMSLGSCSEKNVTNKDDSASIMTSHKKDTNEWSFRSESSSKSGSSSRGGACRRKGRVSAHEWHYKQNRAAAEEMRRKTFLPYKKNLLGCIDVDTLGVLEFSRGYGVESTC